MVWLNPAPKGFASAGLFSACCGGCACGAPNVGVLVPPNPNPVLAGGAAVPPATAPPKENPVVVGGAELGVDVPAPKAVVLAGADVGVDVP